MKYYPVFLDVEEKKCCVVGGGSVAERKARTLVSCGARVWVISPAVTGGLQALAKAGTIRHVRSVYRTGLLSGASVVVAATDDRRVNRAVSRDCRAKNMLVNVVDVPDESNFIVPSLLQRRGLVIAVSTGGKAPCVAKQLRRELARTVLDRYSRMLPRVSAVRSKLKSVCPSAVRRRQALNTFVRSQAVWQRAKARTHPHPIVRSKQ